MSGFGSLRDYKIIQPVIYWYIKDNDKCKILQDIAL